MPKEIQNSAAGDSSTGNASNQGESRSQERYTLTDKKKKDIQSLLQPQPIGQLNDRASEIVPDNLDEFAVVVKRLDGLGEDTKKAKAVLFVHAEKKGLFLLFGFPSIKDLAVKGCGLAASTFYSHLNAAKTGLILPEKYNDLPFVVLEVLSKVAQSDPNRQTILLEILDRAAATPNGITETTVLDAIKQIAPKNSVSGDSARIKSMKTIIKAKDAAVAALGKPESYDEATKEKVLAFEAAA